MSSKQTCAAVAACGPESGLPCGSPAALKLPEFAVPVIKLRQPDGSLLVRAGRPEVVADEVSVKEFSIVTGISVRWIAGLCEQGLIEHRRLTPKSKSKIVIPRSELVRFKRLDDEDIGRSKMPQDVLAAGMAGKNDSRAPYPSAKQCGLILRGLQTP